MAAFTADNAFSGFSVDDIDAAEEFYGATLGLDVERNAMGFLDLRLPRGGSILVYSKPNHTPASFTILNFPVADVDAAVDELIARGVQTKIYSDEEFPPTSAASSAGTGEGRTSRGSATPRATSSPSCRPSPETAPPGAQELPGGAATRGCGWRK